MSNTHQVPIDPAAFKALKEREITGWLVRHDRDFQKGDLVEFVDPPRFMVSDTAEVLAEAEISHVLTPPIAAGVAEGYCHLSLIDVTIHATPHLSRNELGILHNAADDVAAAAKRAGEENAIGTMDLLLKVAFALRNGKTSDL